MKDFYKRFNATYGAFIIADRLGVLNEDADIDLDVAWEMCLRTYDKFLESEYNVTTRSEMDCIDDYLKEA